VSPWACGGAYTAFISHLAPGVREGDSGMTRTVTLRLDRFGRDALDECVRAGQETRSSVLHDAIEYYLGDSGSGRPAWAVPAMAREASDSADPVDIELDEDVHARLEQEAARQHVGSGPLALHALLYYLADIDSGRVSGRPGRNVNTK
jgi:predicted transcriptional regulator